MPWRKLRAAQRHVILEGLDEVWGVRDWFDWLESKSYRTHVRILLARYRAYNTCPDCEGSRLKPAAGWFRVDGRSIAELHGGQLTVLSNPGKGSRFTIRLGKETGLVQQAI